MLEKGFITYILVGSIKEYKALDPGVIENYIDAKKSQYKRVMPELKAMQEIQKFDSAEVYEGYKGILSV